MSRAASLRLHRGQADPPAIRIPAPGPARARWKINGELFEALVWTHSAWAMLDEDARPLGACMLGHIGWVLLRNAEPKGGAR